MLHLKKLCVGVSLVKELADFQRTRKELFHLTRNFPRRAEEVLDGGSLYWIMKGRYAARQKILDIQAVTTDDGRAACRLVLDRPLVFVRADYHRPFQGWRYLTLENATPDGHIADEGGVVPGEMGAEVNRFGIRL